MDPLFSPDGRIVWYLEKISKTIILCVCGSLLNWPGQHVMDRKIMGDNVMDIHSMVCGCMCLAGSHSGKRRAGSGAWPANELG